MKNKLILFSLVLVGAICAMPTVLTGQACPGTSAAISVMNGTRVSTDVFEFDIFFNKEDAADVIKTSAINGALVGIGTSAVMGTYTVVDAPMSPAPTGVLTLSTPIIATLRAMRIVQTATPEASTEAMPLAPTKFGRFRFTRTSGPALPVGDITLTWVTTTAAIPAIVGYCNGNPNSAIYSVANANLTPTGATIPAALPVELIGISATAKPVGNLVEWSTASEVNSQFHIVERSADGMEGWQEIGRSLAAGNSTEKQTYYFTDERPLAMSYYRLKLVDFDGQYEYSKVVSVLRGAVGFTVMNVFPVPADQKVAVQVSLPEAGSLDITVTDMVGRTMQISKVDAVKGLSNVELDLANLAAGTYFVNIDNGTTKLTERIVKQ